MTHAVSIAGTFQSCGRLWIERTDEVEDCLETVRRQLQLRSEPVEMMMKEEVEMSSEDSLCILDYVSYQICFPQIFL